MSVERQSRAGVVCFRCDGKHCHEYIETEHIDFPSALAEAKQQGWTVTRNGDSYDHLCPDCDDD